MLQKHGKFLFRVDFIGFLLGLRKPSSTLLSSSSSEVFLTRFFEFHFRNLQNPNSTKNLVTVTPLSECSSWRASFSLVLAGTFFAPFLDRKTPIKFASCLFVGKTSAVYHTVTLFYFKVTMISGKWLDIVGYQDSGVGFWLANCEFGYGNTSNRHFWGCMLRHTRRYVINQSVFLQHVLFCHVYNRSLYIIFVWADVAEE